MDNITVITDRDGNEQIQIAHDDGFFTVMLKATYEATLAANSAPTAQ